MGSLGDYLMEEVSHFKTSFTIPIGGGIPVPQSAVTTWVIMAIVVLLCIIFVRNLKVIPEGPQVYVEALVGSSITSSVVWSAKKGNVTYRFLEQF